MRETYKERKVWVFPKDRFVDWGPEDESYCRMAGYGYERIEKVVIGTYYESMMGLPFFVKRDKNQDLIDKDIDNNPSFLRRARCSN